MTVALPALLVVRPVLVGDLRDYGPVHVDRAAIDLVAIEKILRVRGMTHEALCQRVGMSDGFWRKCRSGLRRPSGALLARIHAVLSGAEGAPEDAGAADPRRVQVMGMIALASAAYAAQPDLAVALDPRRARRGQRATKAERAAAAARMLGAYLACTVAGMRQADVARVLGIDRAVICRACREIEDSRDDEAFDRLVAGLEASVRGAP